MAIYWPNEQDLSFRMDSLLERLREKHERLTQSPALKPKPKATRAVQPHQTKRRHR